MRKLLFSTILIIIITVSIFHFTNAQQKDAIGVRVMLNHDHFPVAIWYQKQGFKGSPQAIQVDGYDGLQDGNTIYVNAINVANPAINNFAYCEKGASLVDCDTSGAKLKENFYTNIYVISLNDKAGASIKNVFSQIIQNWKFNTNINIKTLSKSQKEIDEIKEKLRRDTRRLADVAYMQYVFEQYQKAYKKYPTLGAGTYLAGETMSKWPSWQEALGQELGINVPQDPINSFYPFEECPASDPGCYCRGYDAATCWDNKEKMFNGRTSIAGGIARIGAAPTGNDYTYTVGGAEKTANLSRALIYYYKSYNNGSSYDFNASQWESPYIGGEYIVKMQTAHSAQNMAPVVKPIGNVEIYPAETKIIEARAYDYNGFTKKLVWNFSEPKLSGTTKDRNKSCASIGGDDEKCCVSNAAFEDALKEDKFYADRFISYKNLKITANNNVNCAGKISFKVTDDNGGISATYSVNVIVKEVPPSIKGLTGDKGVAGYDFKTEVIIGNSPKNKNVFSWQVNKEGGCMQDLNLAEDKKIGGLSLNYAAGKLYVEGRPSKGGLYCLNISAEKGNTYNAKINVFNKPPNISDSENMEAVAGKPFEFSVNADDNSLYPEMDNIAYPQNPLIFSADNTWISYLSFAKGTAKFSAIPPAIGTYKFKIQAVDANGASLKKEFTLKSINHPPIITKIPESPVIRAGADFTGEVKANDEDGHDLTYSITVTPAKNIFSMDHGNITVKNSTVSDAGEYQLTVKASDGYGGEGERTFPFKINNFCGDGAVQVPNMEGVSEVCDGNSQICPITFTEGLPAHCSGIPLEGTQSCNNSCTGWSECVAKPPEIVGGTSTGCYSTSPKANDYACCELVSCSQDGCACCGRGEATTTNGYMNKQSKDVIWSSTQVLELNKDATACGSGGNTPVNACKLNQSIFNNRNWEITTNHSTAQYRCWK